MSYYDNIVGFVIQRMPGSYREETLEEMVREERDLQTRIGLIASAQNDNQERLARVDQFIVRARQRNFKIVSVCAVSIITVVSLRLLYSIARERSW